MNNLQLSQLIRSTGKYDIQLLEDAKRNAEMDIVKKMFKF